MELNDTLIAQVKDLITTETRFLNNADLENWISLFAEDGYYWMPLEEEHEDPESHDSLIYDNRALMEIRKHNLGNPLSPSMQQPVKSVRILSDIEIHNSNNEILVSAVVIAIMYHRQQNYYAGNVTYRLINTGDDLKIKTKRVDLLNADSPLDPIMMYI